MEEYEVQDRVDAVRSAIGDEEADTNKADDALTELANELYEALARLKLLDGLIYDLSRV